MQKSPSGAMFPYYFKDGELFGLHLGSFFADEDRLVDMIKAEEVFFLRQNRCIGLWIDFYQSKLTDRVMGEFIEYLNHTYERITKLAIVGCSSRDKRRISSLIKKAACLSALPVRYYSDPEEAKSWLVNESA